MDTVDTIAREILMALIAAQNEHIIHMVYTLYKANFCMLSESGKFEVTLADGNAYVVTVEVKTDET